MQFCVILSLLIFAKEIFGDDIILRYLKKCDKSAFMDIQIDCKRISEMHYCNLTFKTPVELGVNQRAEINIYLLRGKRWFNVANIKDQKGLCHTVETYLRPVLYEQLRAAGRQPQCPIEKGTIDAKDFELNLEYIASLPIIPKGVIRLDVNAIEKATGRLALCLVIEAEFIK